MHEVSRLLKRLDLPGKPRGIAIGGRWISGSGQVIASRCPIDGSELTSLRCAAGEQVAEVTRAAADAFRLWRVVPPPKRGEYVRRLGDAFRKHKQDLAALVTLEAGKITQEALGEVQEVIDICDFAVGLSRQLYGLTIATERPAHRLAEQWHPLGPVGVITAFNFPVAVWAWNAMVGLVCGDPILWKPSEKTPLTAIACQAIAASVARQMGDVPPGVVSLVIGGPDVGQAMAQCRELPLISATGSVPMGRAVAQTVAARLGRSLLELGGNNGAVVSPSADLELAVRAIVFAAAGTCGQRCTTLRRLIVHRSIADKLLRRLVKVYRGLPIGDPRRPGVLVGPLIDESAAHVMDQALRLAREQGGKIHGGGRISTSRDRQGAVPRGGFYVNPAIVEIGPDAPIVREETFAPILYFMRYDSLDEAIAIHNGVPQGLASAIFTSDLREAEIFCGPAGSDCGIVNVNAGPSGAEIGGAFGGEKDTGGGRESGSNAWQTYMRRCTNTVNYSKELPLAQGIKFQF